MSSKPYLWPEPIFLSSRQAPKVYRLEGELSRKRDELAEELEAALYTKGRCRRTKRHSSMRRKRRLQQEREQK